MLHGRQVTLRPVTIDDMRALYAGDTAPDLWAQTTRAPWRPMSLPEYVRWIEEQAGRPDAVLLTIATGDRAVGYATVWGVDEHNRIAEAGVALVDPADRGHGLGRQALALLSVYAFVLRDLARLTLHTHADNVAMLRAAQACGYRREGALREHAYVGGRRVDVAVLGLLREEWLAAGGPPDGWAGGYGSG